MDFKEDMQLSFAQRPSGCPPALPSFPGLNLSIAQGETLVLLGRSGSGKTTTLKLINRLLEPTEGEILIYRAS